MGQEAEMEEGGEEKAGTGFVNSGNWLKGKWKWGVRECQSFELSIETMKKMKKGEGVGRRKTYRISVYKCL